MLLFGWLVPELDEHLIALAAAERSEAKATSGASDDADAGTNSAPVLPPRPSTSEETSGVKKAMTVADLMRKRQQQLADKAKLTTDADGRAVLKKSPKSQNEGAGAIDSAGASVEERKRQENFDVSDRKKDALTVEELMEKRKKQLKAKRDKEA